MRFEANFALNKSIFQGLIFDNFTINTYFMTIEDK